MDEWLRVVEYCLGVISIIGCFFVIFVFLSYKKLRSFPFESVVYLTISSMLATVSYLLYYIQNHESIDNTMCNIQAFGMVWFENSQYLWATLIGYSVYQAVINFDDNNKKTDWVKRLKYLLIGYVLPLLFAVIGLIRGVFGPSGQWCWIDTTHENTEKYIFSWTLYGLVWVLIFSNFLLNFRVIRYLNAHFTSKEERELVKGYIWKLLRYPIIQIICVFPATINRFLQIVLNKEIFAFQIIQIFSTLSQGLLYAIAYGYTTQVRKALFETFQKHLPCFCCCCNKLRRESESSEVSEKTQKLFDKSENPSESNNTYEDEYDSDDNGGGNSLKSDKSDKKVILAIK